MCRGLIGKKMGMTALYSQEGRQIPVTAVQLGPCIVTQIKTEATDGYNALQLAFGERKLSRINKPLKGHLKKSNVKSCGILKEVSVDNPTEYTLGQSISLDIFIVGEKVDIIGSTKGRGFSGVIKRHGFSGGRDTHGSKCHRVPGSIGCSAWPSKVIKGKKLPGRYGNERQTVRSLEIVDIRHEENIILLKGAIPGSRSGIVIVRKAKAKNK